MKIEISNRQTKHRVRPGNIRRFSRWIMKQVQALDPRRIWGELSIVLADDEHMRLLHRDHFGREEVTDVISFAYPPAPGESVHTGEVIVNVEQAVREGPRQAGSQSELALYLAHGCHHLTGASDETPAGRRRMRRIEQDWLRQADELGLPGELIQRGEEPITR